MKNIVQKFLELIGRIRRPETVEENINPTTLAEIAKAAEKALVDKRVKETLDQIKSYAQLGFWCYTRYSNAPDYAIDVKVVEKLKLIGFSNTLLDKNSITVSWKRLDETAKPSSTGAEPFFTEEEIKTIREGSLPGTTVYYVGIDPSNVKHIFSFAAMSGMNKVEWGEAGVPDKVTFMLYSKSEPTKTFDYFLRNDNNFDNAGGVR